MKDCGFYFDAPTIQDENSMKRTLQRKYDGLFEDGWRPALQSRRDLMTWACNQYNKAHDGKEGFEAANCENYSVMLKEFGPDYDRLKPKLGFIKGMFD